MVCSTSAQNSGRETSKCIHSMHCPMYRNEHKEKQKQSCHLLLRPAPFLCSPTFCILCACLQRRIHIIQPSDDLWTHACPFIHALSNFHRVAESRSKKIVYPVWFKMPWSCLSSFKRPWPSCCRTPCRGFYGWKASYQLSCSNDQRRGKRKRDITQGLHSKHHTKPHCCLSCHPDNESR